METTAQYLTRTYSQAELSIMLTEAAATQRSYAANCAHHTAQGSDYATSAALAQQTSENRTQAIWSALLSK